MDKKALRVLLVEDNPNDAELVLRELRRAGFEPDWQRVDTELEFAASLDPNLDIILSDYAMPNFSGLRALELLKQKGLDVPFVLVSGTIGEETAVTAMRSGAADYLLKDRMKRLGQSVSQALEQRRLLEQQKHAEQAMQQSEHKYRHLFESLSEAAFLIDSKSRRILDVNLCAEKLLGRTRSEILGMNEAELFPPNEAADSCAKLVSAGLRGNGELNEAQVLSKDGTKVPVQVSLAPIELYGRDLVLALMADITEHKRAEERLREQAEMLNRAHDAIIVRNFDDRRIVFWNAGAERLYGWTASEAIGQPIELVLANPAELGPISRKLLSAGEFRGELKKITKDKKKLTVEVWSTLIRNPDGSPRTVLSINNDISDRKRAEERLREQADIINHARDAIIIRNFADQRVTFWNSGAERLYGWSATEAVGRPIGELIVADPQEVETYTRIIGSAGEFRGEVKQRTKDGKEIVVDGRATLIRNANGTPRSVLLINTDVTEQKNLESHLLRAQRLESIGTLASGVAHDLNNVLTPILMCSEVLRSELGEQDRQSALALIEESAKRGAGIVKQVLTFARGIEGERVVIKPSHLIQEIVDIARKTFPKSIEISGRYPDDLWSIQGDPTQLHQVLLNLSVNARDAMPDGGSLTIWAENLVVDEHYASMMPDARAGEFVALRVSDTGTGMPRAVADKIFEPFFTTKEIGKGTGLGLSTSLGIVKSHGGFISVYSEQGKGTTFKLFLPASMTQDEAQSSKTSVVPIEGNGELILVVDDESNILRATKMILEKHQYDVLSAGDGPEALAIFAQQMQSIRLVLTDTSMPYMDGAALARALKKMKSDLPIIASTGQDEQAGLPEFEALGVKNFLAKPYNTEQLLATIHDVLHQTG